MNVTGCPSGSDAGTCTCSGWPTTCDSGPVVVTTGAPFAGLIVQVKDRVIGEVPSVTETITKNVPAVVGTPLIRPVADASAKPFGSPDAE